MKIRSLALIMTLVSLVSFAGCTKNQVGCAVQDSAVAVLTPVIASGLQCSNPTAITATLNQLGSQAGLCTQAQSLAKGQQSIGGSACTIVAGLLISSLAGSAIPATWGCSAANAQATLNSLVNQACAKIP
jgi:hypothetical protein